MSCDAASPVAHSPHHPEVMERSFDLRVPLKVDVEVGENWLEMG